MSPDFSPTRYVILIRRKAKREFAFADSLSKLQDARKVRHLLKPPSLES